MQLNELGDTLRVLELPVEKDEKDIVEEQAMPADWSPAKRRQTGVAACWAKKHGKSYFGYKLSASAG